MRRRYLLALLPQLPGSVWFLYEIYRPPDSAGMNPVWVLGACVFLLAVVALVLGKARWDSLVPFLLGFGGWVLFSAAIAAFAVVSAPGGEGTTAIVFLVLALWACLLAAFLAFLMLVAVLALVRWRLQKR